MQLACLGSVGIGAVWGWLVAWLDQDDTRFWVKFIIIAISTLALAALVTIMAGTQSLWCFLGATGVAFLSNLAWRGALRKRFGAT